MTSQLGTSLSQLGNLQLGAGASSGGNEVLNRFLNESLTFSDIMDGWKLSGISNDTITFTSGFSFHANFTASCTDSLTFSDSLPQVCGDTLDLTDEMLGYKTYHADFTSNLTFSSNFTVAGNFTRSFNETLNFTELTTRNIIKLVGGNDTVTFNEVWTGSLTKPTSDTLVFSDDTTADLSHGAFDTLDLDSLFTLNANFTKLTGDVFEPFERVYVNTTLRLAAADTLVFSDVARAYRTYYPSDTLVFTDTITGVGSRSVVDTWTLIDGAAALKIVNRATTDLLVLADTTHVNIVVSTDKSESLVFADSIKGVRVQFATANDTLSFTNTLFREIHEAISTETLTFSGNLTVTKRALGISTDTLSLTESLSVATVLTRSVGDVLSFVERPPPDLFDPDVPTPTQGVIGVIADRNMLLIGTTRSIVLPPAEFNDFYSDRSQVVFKRKMGGAVSTYVKSTGKQKLHYEFIMTRGKANEFQQFLDAENENYITIHDWKGQSWITKLYSDSVDFTEVGRWSPSGNKVQVTLEFIGSRYA